MSGRIYATAPPEGGWMNVFLDEEQRERALVLHEGFLEKLVWGGKVWGVRVALDAADPEVIAALLHQAWETKARPPARRKRAPRRT